MVMPTSEYPAKRILEQGLRKAVLNREVSLTALLTELAPDPDICFEVGYQVELDCETVKQWRTLGDVKASCLIEKMEQRGGRFVLLLAYVTLQIFNCPPEALVRAMDVTKNRFGNKLHRVAFKGDQVTFTWT